MFYCCFTCLFAITKQKYVLNIKWAKEYLEIMSDGILIKAEWYNHCTTPLLPIEMLKKFRL